MAKLDPFIIQWPQKWVEDPEIGPTIHYLNMFLHSMYEVTDGGDAIENADSSGSFFSSQLQQLRKQIEGLPEFTIDTSGFTTDLTFITTDKVIA